MRLWPLGIAIAGSVAGLWHGPVAPQVVILSGNTDGNLAPCGCTKPMTGGIKRRVEAAHELSLPGHTTLLDNGDLVAGTSRQDELKAQTVAEILGKGGWDAINIGPADAKLGIGMVLSMNSLSQGKLVQSEIQPGAEPEIHRFVMSPPFLIIAGATRAEDVGGPISLPTSKVDDAINEGIEQAKEGNLAPVLLLQGSHEDAVNLAHEFPQLSLIEYRSMGSPPEAIEQVGDTSLVSPGSEAKYILRLEYSNGRFRNYQAVSLGPQYKDDPTAARLYRTYLSRVDGEHLVDQVPRFETTQFSGSQACGKCHFQAFAVWKKSLHSHALQTLAERGHEQDPECLACHVVGLTSVHGFRSMQTTSDLGFVGCESCHGGGFEHSKNPVRFRLPTVDQTTCVKCHTSNTSPGFDFSSFWKRIKH